MQPVVTSRLVWQVRSEQWNKADFDSINGYLQSQPPRTCAHKHLNQQLCYDVYLSGKNNCKNSLRVHSK